MNNNEIEDRNRKDALELAKGIYEVVNDPKFKDNFTPDDRHKIILQRYPNFAQAFPVVLRYIARDLRYNEQAFIKFLDKLKTDPGKGMDGFIQRQADYAKFLYFEDCKLKGVHWNMKTANEIWQMEYNNMNKNVKKLQKQEKEARNEFDELEKKNLQLRKEELLDFINRETPTEVAEEKEKEEVDPEILDPKNIIMMVRQAKDARLGIVENINDKKTIITNISARLNLPTPVFDPIPELENDVKPADIMEMDKPKLVAILRDINKNTTQLAVIEEEITKRCEEFEKKYQNSQTQKDVDASWKKHVDEMLNPKKKERKSKENKNLTPEEKLRKKQEKEARKKQEQAEINKILANF
jgi:hypothetical protein